MDPNPNAVGRRHLIVVFEDPLVTDSIQLHPMAASVQVNLTMEVLGYIPPIGKGNHCDLFDGLHLLRMKKVWSNFSR